MPGDNAGNTLNTARTIDISLGMQTFGDRVDALDPNDYYRFTLNTPSNLNLTLRSLSSDANLQLLNGDGTLLQTSANTATAADTLNRSLSPGTYYLRVFPATPTSDTDYTLHFNLQGSSSRQNILWRDDATGTNSLWFMGGASNTVSIGSTSLPSLAPSWQLAASADFNNDGVFDLVWRNYTTGDNTIWFMGGANNASLLSSATLISIPTSWHIEAVADFNQDNSPDIFWRDYGSGTNGIWFMGGANNTSIASIANLDSVSTNWRVEAIADFNDDRTPDLLWRESGSGINGIWFMGGASNTSIASIANLDSVPPVWRIEGVSDFNNDGAIDLLWRESNVGATGIWLMGGASNTSIVSIASIDSLPPNWRPTPLTQFSQPPRIDGAGNTLTTAFDVGTLSGTATYRDFVDVSDANDYYRFTLNSRSSFNLSLNELAGDADVQLLSANGTILQTSTRSGVLPEALTATLEADSYLVRVYPYRGATTYALNLSAIAIAPPSPTVTLTPTDANAAETPTGQPANSGQFTVTRTGDLATALTVNLGRNGTATSGIDYSSLPTSVVIPVGQASVTIPVTVLDDTLIEGNETVILSLASGNGYIIGSAATGTVTIADNDTLIDGAGNTFDTARDLGVLGSQQIFGDRVDSTDTNDYYRFSLLNSANFSLTLNGMSADADVQLFNDNRELITGSYQGSSAPETINRLLTAGTYFIQIFPFSQAATNYNLTVSATTATPPTVTLTATDSSAAETTPGQLANSGQFTLTRTGSTNTALTVNYTIGGTAGNNTDYNQISNSIIIPIGQTSVTIPIVVIDDSLVENNETVVLTLNANSNYVLGSTTSGTVTLADNDAAIPTIALTVSDSQAAETPIGQSFNSGQFTITRTGNTATALTVNYTLGGTAGNGTDYNQTGNSIMIPMGQTSVTIPITVIDDSLVEPNETVSLTLNANSNYILGSSTTGTVTIADNDQLPTVSIALIDNSAAETTSGQTPNAGQFTLTRTGSTSTALTINYTLSGTATNGVDYTQTGNSLVIPVGQTSVTLPITVIDDAAIEGNETVVLTLNSSNNYILGSGTTGTVTIVDNDVALPTVTLTASDSQAAETRTGETFNPGQFTLSRTGSTTTALTVNYTIAGTATNGSDYNQLSNSVVIPIGQTSVTVPITVIDDVAVEGSETVSLTLNSNSNYVLGSNTTGTVTIADNDPLTITDPTVARTSTTGNLAIDALLTADPYNYYWNTSSNGGTITYSFYTATSGSYYGFERVSEVSSAIKTNVRNILASLSSFINVNFVEVADTSSRYGVLRYMFSDDPYYAYAYYPTANRIGGDVHLSANYEDDPSGAFSGGLGTYGYETLIHETFHALGLKHPGNYNGGGTGEPPFLSANDDNNTNSVMTYNNAGANGVTPMAYDIRALQHLYGARNTHSTATNYAFNSVYSYTTNGQTFGSTTQVKQSLWDSGGVDTLDFSGLAPSTSYHFDLRQGGILTTQAAHNATTYWDESGGGTASTSTFGTTIAYNTVIENLVNSRGNDRIIANSASNIFRGYTLGTSTGNDVIEESGSTDVIELVGYSLTNLTASFTGTDLSVSLGTNGSLQIKNYTSPGGALRFLIGGAYYRYIANGWQVAADAIADNDRESLKIFTSSGLTGQPAEAVHDTSAIVACNCAACTSNRLNILGDTDLEAAIGLA